MNFEDWIKQLKEAGDKATKGPWKKACAVAGHYIDDYGEVEETIAACGPEIRSGEGYQGVSNDAVFITLSRNNWDTTLDLLVQYRRALTKICYQSIITSETGPLLDKASEALALKPWSEKK
jgi:hypothetical protein